MRFVSASTVQNQSEAANRLPLLLGLPTAARRRGFLLVAGALVVALAAPMAVTLTRGGFDAVDLLLIALFAMTLPWTVIGFLNAVIGLIVMRSTADPAGVAPRQPSQPARNATAVAANEMLQGSFKFDEETGEMSDLVVSVDTASIFTNHKERDEHLRSPDFLNSAEFPQMVFRANQSKPVEGRRYRLEGELELLGLSKPVTLEATWNKSGEYPFADNPYVMGVSARGHFQRSAFGMNYSVENGRVGDEVEVIIDFEARRQ